MNKAKVKIIVRAMVLICIVSGGTYWYFDHSEKYPGTDDAYVNANLVNVAPKVSGYVTDILVKNNQFVHKGKVLFRIETKDYTVQLAQEEQALKYAQEQANVAKTQVNTASANVASAKANYEYMTSQVARYTMMNQQNAASTQDVQNYRTQQATAKAQLQQAQDALTQAKTQVDAASAQIAQAQAGVDNAQNHVGYTDVISSVNGYVTNMYLTSGQFVGVGQQVFGLVDNDSWWIDANFKEDDIERIKSGQPVKISLDMYKHAKYQGIIQSISYARQCRHEILSHITKQRI